MPRNRTFGDDGPRPTDPLWMEMAWKDLGVTQVPGKKRSNPRIDEMFRHSKKKEWRAFRDDKNWCAAAMNLWMAEAGIRHPGRPDARSYLQFGTPIPLESRIPRGAILVFWRDRPKSWKGHVGMCVADKEPEGLRIHTLGGNQATRVCVVPMMRHTLLGARWPKGYPVRRADPELPPLPPRSKRKAALEQLEEDLEKPVRSIPLSEH